MKQILTLLIVFLLSACTFDDSIIVTFQNNSDKEISGNMYVSNEVLVENISVFSYNQKEIKFFVRDVNKLLNKREGTLKFITASQEFEVCGYMETEFKTICGVKNIHMTIQEDMSYDVEYK